jgi:biotin synthase-like enzyme
MGESLEQRAALATELAALAPDEVPLNILNPRPGTPIADRPVMSSQDALRTIAAFRLAMPRTILRYAGGRELTLGYYRLLCRIGVRPDSVQVRTSLCSQTSRCRSGF